MTSTGESSALPPRANVVKLSERDLLDYRAVQRTFDGAYARTALGQLAYATVILRLFQPKFFYVGLVYAVLGMGFIPVAIFRYRMAVSNAQRLLPLETLQLQPDLTSTHGSDTATPHEALHSGPIPRTVQRADPGDAARAPVQTVLRECFVTAGSVVAAATVFVGLAEIALLVLILRV